MEPQIVDPSTVTEETSDEELERQSNLLDILKRLARTPTESGGYEITIEDVIEYFTETYENIGFEHQGVEVFNTLADMILYWRMR